LHQLCAELRLGTVAEVLGNMRLGFQFVPFPREIWTDGVNLSQAEFRLLGWFCCNLRFGIPQLEFTDDNILNGVSKNGQTYPRVGLSRNSMQKARELLVGKELLSAKQLSGGGGRGKAAVWLYSLNLSGSEKNAAETSQTVTINHSESEMFTGLNLSDSDNAIRKERTSKAEKGKSTPLPEWMPLHSWEAFLEMRKAIRAPITERAGEMLIRSLEGLRADGENPAAVLDQSTMNNWKGLFPVKRNGKGTKYEQQFDQIIADRQATHEILRRREQANQSGAVDSGQVIHDVSGHEQAEPSPSDPGDNGAGSRFRVIRRTVTARPVAAPERA